MPEKIKEFFDDEEKYLNESIEEAKQEQKEQGYDISIAFEHYWGRRTELKYIKKKLFELFKEVSDGSYIKD